MTAFVRTFRGHPPKPPCISPAASYVPPHGRRARDNSAPHPLPRGPPPPHPLLRPEPGPPSPRRRTRRHDFFSSSALSTQSPALRRPRRNRTPDLGLPSRHRRPHRLPPQRIRPPRPPAHPHLPRRRHQVLRQPHRKTPSRHRHPPRPQSPRSHNPWWHDSPRRAHLLSFLPQRGRWPRRGGRRRGLHLYLFYRASLILTRPLNSQLLQPRLTCSPPHLFTCSLLTSLPPTPAPSTPLPQPSPPTPSPRSP